MAVSLDKYFTRVVGRKEPVSREKEQELLREFAGGNVESRNRLVEHNLRFVIAEAVKVARQRNAFEFLHDLINIGAEYVTEKAASYDLDKRREDGKHPRFLSFFKPYLKKRMTEELGLLRNPAIEPKCIQEYHSYRDTLGRLENEGIEPTAEMLSEETSLPISRIKRYMEFDSRVQLSLDARCSRANESNFTLAESTPDRSNGDFEQLLYSEIIQTYLPLLDPRERRVIEIRYLSKDCMGYREIGKELGISKSRAEQLHNRALRKLKIFIEVQKARKVKQVYNT